MGRRTRILGAAAAVVLTVLVAGCSRAVDGDATWPRAELDRVKLSATDVPTGAVFSDLTTDAGQITINKKQVSAGPMPSKPTGCAEGMSKAVASTGKPGPEFLVRYMVQMNGASIVVNVAQWSLDLAAVRAVATRCAKYQVFFDADSPGIDMTTEPVPDAPDGVLAYKQTSTRPNGRSVSYMALANVDHLAVFATAFEQVNPHIPAKATMPKSFLDIVAAQADKIRRS